jgi:hypothetical protein
VIDRSPKPCVNCGKLIEYDSKRGPKRWARRLYCSNVCTFSPPPKTCAFCGSSFEKDRFCSRAQWERQRFCSKSCAIRARAKPKPPPPEPEPPPKPKVCEVCFSEFELGPGEGRKAFEKRRACSPACGLLLAARERVERRIPAHERVLRRTHRPSPEDCWLWQGAKSQGYGVIQLGRGKGTAKAHRVVYEALVGPIPEGMTLDHLCFEPSCVNPAHLEPCSREENTRRQIAAGRGRGGRHA